MKRKIATVQLSRERPLTLLCTDQRLSREIAELPSRLLTAALEAPWRTPRRACPPHQKLPDSATTTADGPNGVLRCCSFIRHDLLVREYSCRTRCLGMRGLVLPSSITGSYYSSVDTEFELELQLTQWDYHQGPRSSEHYMSYS